MKEPSIEERLTRGLDEVASRVPDEPVPLVPRESSHPPSMRTWTRALVAAAVVLVVVGLGLVVLKEGNSDVSVATDARRGINRSPDTEAMSTTSTTSTASDCQFTGVADYPFDPVHATPEAAAKAYLPQSTEWSLSVRGTEQRPEGKVVRLDVVDSLTGRIEAVADVHERDGRWGMSSAHLCRGRDSLLL